MHAITLTVVTGAALAFALWIRRFTWGNDWEKAITLSVALQLAALLLTSPISTPYVGMPLARLTGVYNLDAVLGHDLYIVAASAVLYHILFSLHDDEGLHKRFRLYVELPCTVVLPILLTTYAQSETAHIPMIDMFDAQDETLQPYWTALTVVVGYLLAFAAWHFAIAWRDPAYRWECTGYIAASLAGVAACILRLGGNAWDIPAGPVWLAIATCGALFAGTAGFQWKRQLQREPAMV